MTTTRGSSVTTPNAMISWAAKAKYLSAVMRGSKTFCWKLSSTPNARGSTHRYAADAPARNSRAPADSAGMIRRRSRSYSAGVRNAQAWYPTTGDASTTPTTKANLRVMKNGSVGLGTRSLPPGISGLIGSISRPMTSMCSTITQPTSVPTTMASRLYRIRQRSSSRWSRNGISARLSGVSGTTHDGPAGLAPQALQLVVREIGLVGAGVARDDPTIIGTGSRLVAPLLGEQPQLVQRRGRPRRVGIGPHDLLIHRGRRIRALPRERLAHVVQRIGRPLVRREHAQKLAKPEACRGEAAPAELLQRQLVHLVRSRPRGVPRGPDRDGGAAVAGIRDRHGLTRLLLQLAPQLGQPLLALPGQLLHRDELLLHAEQLGLQVTAQLDQVGLLRRELLLRRRQEHAHGVDLGRPRAVAPHALHAQRLDLELDAPHVALEGAAGGEPQADERQPRARHTPAAQGCFRASPPARISNSSRRFFAQASSSWPGSMGRSSPYDTVSIRLASMPWLARYCLAAVARRFPSARLYSSEPRSSQCPLTRMRRPGLACRIDTFWSRTDASPARMIALS